MQCNLWAAVLYSYADGHTVKCYFSQTFFYCLHFQICCRMLILLLTLVIVISTGGWGTYDLSTDCLHSVF